MSNFFENFRRYFASHGATPVSTTQVTNLPVLSTTLVAILPPVSKTPSVNFATGTAGVVDTSGKFATIVNDTRGKLPLVSMNTLN